MITLGGTKGSRREAMIQLGKRLGGGEAVRRSSAKACSTAAAIAAA